MNLMPPELLPHVLECTRALVHMATPATHSLPSVYVASSHGGYDSQQHLVCVDYKVSTVGLTRLPSAELQGMAHLTKGVCQAGRLATKIDTRREK